MAECTGKIDLLNGVEKRYKKIISNNMPFGRHT